MKIIKKQRGATGITIALGLVLLAFFVLIAVTLWPIYMEYFSVSSHLNRLGSDPNVKSMSKDEILKSLEKRFGIDDVKNVGRKDIIITGEAGSGYEVEVDYEVRKQFLGNVELVVVFNKVVTVK